MSICPKNKSSKGRRDKRRANCKIISTPDSKVTVCIIPTNEELAIARETVALVG